MHIIIGIIAVCIIFGILSSIFEWIREKLTDLFEWLSEKFGMPMVIISIVLSLVVLFVFSWQISLIVLVGGFILGFIFKQISKGAENVSKRIEQHDLHKKETARIYQQTEEAKEMHANEKALQEELNKNCRWLGYMNEEMWLRKLPNFANKKYSKSFAEITQNFAIQLEKQNITQNDDWFKPFLEYILNKGSGTPTKMLNEVDCPQLRTTHFTSDIVLLTNELESCTKPKSKDVPARLDAVRLDGFSEFLYLPSKYLKQQYGHEAAPVASHSEEISFDDL